MGDVPEPTSTRAEKYHHRETARWGHHKAMQDLSSCLLAREEIPAKIESHRCARLFTEGRINAKRRRPRTRIMHPKMADRCVLSADLFPRGNDNMEVEQVTGVSERSLVPLLVPLSPVLGRLSHLSAAAGKDNLQAAIRTVLGFFCFAMQFKLDPGGLESFVNGQLHSHTHSTIYLSPHCTIYL